MGKKLKGKVRPLFVFQLKVGGIQRDRSDTLQLLHTHMSGVDFLPSPATAQTVIIDAVTNISLLLRSAAFRAASCIVRRPWKSCHNGFQVSD